MSEQGWRRLGEWVTRERGRNYRTRAQFAAATGVSERVLDDLETGKRTRYTVRTLSSVERSLGWTYGSCLRVVAGGRPLRIQDPQTARMAELWPMLSPEVRDVIITISEASLDGRRERD